MGNMDAIESVELDRWFGVRHEFRAGMENGSR